MPSARIHLDHFPAYAHQVIPMIIEDKFVSSQPLDAQRLLVPLAVVQLEVLGFHAIAPEVIRVWVVADPIVWF